MTNTNNKAKSLRKTTTEPEKIMWQHLRNRRFLGYKFRRQYPIDKYVVDFICMEKNLIIELDGREHLEKDAIENDRKRSSYLESIGYKLIRFYNNDILNNIDNVLKCLFNELVSPSSGLQPPSPLKGEGEEKSPSFGLQPPPPLKGEGEEKSPSSGLQPPSPLKGEENYNKQQLRKQAKEIRSKLDMQVLSEKLVEKLKATKEYKKAKNIMIFYPLKDEVNLLSLTNDKTKTFYLPKIDGDNLLCCIYDKDSPLCESCFHTKEPNTQPEDNSKIDLIIVPALAVDKNNYRLGYGKGFYDRFLKQFTTPVKTVVCIPKQLIIKTIFPNEFDIPVNLVITD